MPNRRVLCKFFAQGSCLKDGSCKFSHDWSAPSNRVCAFYQKGSCSYGSRCRYEHAKSSRSVPSASASPANLSECMVSGITDAVSATTRSLLAPDIPALAKNLGDNIASDNSGIGKSRSPNPADHPICSFAADGNCPRGELCPHIHGDLCPTCGKHCLHPFRPQEREEHFITCKKRHQHLEALKRSEEVECSVCLEHVFSKPIESERKFGILSECDHPFCISCIRNWRSSSRTPGMDDNSASRACPMCRKLSYFVIPSVIWYSTKEEKAEIVDSYKKKLRSIDCKHFNLGNGICKFGSSCFYKHTVKPGSYLWNATLMPDFRDSNSDDDDDDESEWITDDGEDESELADMFEHVHYPHIPFGFGMMDDLISEGDLDDAMASLFLLSLFDD